ncbi:DUF2142 domain-containing protein [Actinospica sp. MGRD01-02]|uniref:DUF2142 domain-containing protein n=1 Tax=Actinospica acidithermotolerans TaxID=2828514 RepID=A0A941IMF0_9ACTN|nr:DUF2142 domain-containing protein [Actinospica acidithermotolerans]MBR7828506.1 DUF2142 domain-containing protein [Actinospica acidithermotolerans]
MSPTRATPSFAARRVVARMGAARLVWAVAFTAFFLIGAAWSLAMPYDGPADEMQHVTRAYGVASGQIFAGPADSKVYTAKSLVPHGTACFRWNLQASAKCQQTPGANVQSQHEHTRYISGASGYDPSYYLLVGPVIHIWPTMKGIVLARLITDAEISALLASAVAVAWSGGRRLWFIAGIAVGVTPAVVNLMGAVNPAGVEIGAAIAYWVSLLDLTAHGPVRRPVVALMCCSGALLAVTRGFGVGWLAAITVICVFNADREKLRALWRSRGMRLALAGVACACAIALAWDELAGPNFDLAGATTAPNTPPVQLAAQELWNRLPGYIDGMTRLTSYGDIPIPGVVSQIWLAFLGVILVGGLWLGSVRAKIQIGGTIVIAFAMLMITDASALRQGFYFSQGRYALPLLAGAPMIAAIELGRSGALGAERARTLLRWMAAVLLPLQFVALWVSMLRFERGFPADNVLPLNPLTEKWVPPLGPVVPLALMAVGLIVFAVCMWRPVLSSAAVRLTAVGALLREPVRRRSAGAP